MPAGRRIRRVSLLSLGACSWHEGGFAAKDMIERDYIRRRQTRAGKGRTDSARRRKFSAEVGGCRSKPTREREAGKDAVGSPVSCGRYMKGGVGSRLRG